MDDLFAARDLPDAKGETSARLTITGDGLGAVFEAFMAERARRLDLALRIEPAHGSAARTRHIHLTGHPTLIDMFEMATILGPIESRVESVQVHWTSNR